MQNKTKAQKLVLDYPLSAFLATHARAVAEETRHHPLFSCRYSPLVSFVFHKKRKRKMDCRIKEKSKINHPIIHKEVKSVQNEKQYSFLVLLTDVMYRERSRKFKPRFRFHRNDTLGF